MTSDTRRGKNRPALRSSDSAESLLSRRSWNALTAYYDRPVTIGELTELRLRDLLMIRGVGLAAAQDVLGAAHTALTNASYNASEPSDVVVTFKV